MSLFAGAEVAGPAQVCSARGCRAAAAHALRWRNPRLHSPDRRKTWLACPEHEQYLVEFLSVRGFLTEVLPIAELPDATG